VVAELVQSVVRLRGADSFFNDWLYSALLFAASGLCLARVAVRRDARGAWLALGLGLLAWALGDAIFSLRFGATASPPAVTASDALWLAWYPLTMVGLFLLVRERVPRFELHRWVDGVAAALLLAVPWIGLILEPAVAESKLSGAAKAVNVLYPLADMLLVGALVGVMALMAWRPGRMWLQLATGVALMTVADALYATQVLESHYHPGVQGVFWPAGALVMAYAAWQPAPGELAPVRAVGWRAIALPVAAQALAAGIQVVALFRELGVGERLISVLVIAIATVQIIISRPRPDGA
jgi:hypothetical protein